MNKQYSFLSLLFSLLLVLPSCGGKKAEQTASTTDTAGAEASAAAETLPDTLPMLWCVPAWNNDPMIDRKYGLPNLTDGNAATCLVVHPNPSEYATDYDREVRLVVCADAQTISALIFRNGYCKSDEIYAKNSRVRCVAVYDLADLDYNPLTFEPEAAPLFEGDLADSAEPQTITLPERKGMNAVVLCIRTNKIYPGSAWKDDICLSELSCLGEKNAAEEKEDTFTSADMRPFFLQGHVSRMVDLNTHLVVDFDGQGRLTKASIAGYEQDQMQIERNDEGELRTIQGGGDGDYQGYSFSVDGKNEPAILLYYFGDAGGETHIVYEKGKSPLCPGIEQWNREECGMEDPEVCVPSVKYTLFDSHGNWLECKIDKRQPETDESPRFVCLRRLVYYHE